MSKGSVPPGFKAGQFLSSHSSWTDGFYMNMALILREMLPPVVATKVLHKTKNISAMQRIVDSEVVVIF